jgi:predicted  nucleic acid-binding Zn-ribbon protein
MAMTEVSDTTYDSYLDGLAAAKEEELGKKLVQAEERLEEVRNQIVGFTEEAQTYYDSEVGETRIAGYANEEHLHELELEEEELEKLVDKLDEQLAAI